MRSGRRLRGNEIGRTGDPQPYPGFRRLSNVSGADQEFAFQGIATSLYIVEYNAVGKYARFALSYARFAPAVSLSPDKVACRASIAMLMGPST
jgi:hypothetical protein